MTRFGFITFLILITAAEFLMAKTTASTTTVENDSNISEGKEDYLKLPWKLTMKFQLSFLKKSSSDQNNIANPPESMISSNIVGVSGGGGVDRSSSSSSSDHRVTRVQGERQELDAESPGAETEEEARKILRRRDRSSEVAGGGVIIGGLVTVFSASLYCYIRVTRTRK